MLEAVLLTGKSGESICSNIQFVLTIFPHPNLVTMWCGHFYLEQGYNIQTTKQLNKRSTTTCPSQCLSQGSPSSWISALASSIFYLTLNPDPQQEDHHWRGHLQCYQVHLRFHRQEMSSQLSLFLIDSHALDTQLITSWWVGCLRLPCLVFPQSWRIHSCQLCLLLSFKWLVYALVHRLYDRSAPTGRTFQSTTAHNLRLYIYFQIYRTFTWTWS